MFLFSFVFLSVCQASGQFNFTLPFDPSPFDSGNSTALGGNHGALWKILNGTHIHFAVAAKTNGWVGFGLNSYPGMPGADITIGRMVNNEMVVRDYFAKDYALPEEDYTQDIHVTSAGRSNGVTWFIFIKPFSTSCSREDKQLTNLDIIYDGLFAFGTSDTLAYHFTNRQTLKLSLNAPVETALPGDVQLLTITAPSAIAPALSGSYVCSYHELPADVPYHLVKYSVVLGTATSSGILHHVNMAACTGPLNGATLNTVISCEAAMGVCSESWLTSGYVPVTLPSTVGIPFGQGGTRYVIISRHFYNPGLLSNVVDTGTGYKLWYTANLRPAAIGTLNLGLTDFTVPPGTSRYEVPALCPSQCTNMFASSVTVTGVSFHMHTHGAGATLKVIRDGEEQPELGRVDPWDPSHSSISTHYILQPGDILWLTCLFNNPLSTPIVYGDGLDSEMCFAFLTYYPKVNWFSCYDFPNGYNQPPPPECSGVPIEFYRGCDMGYPRTYCPNQLSVSQDQWNTTDRTRSFIPALPPNDQGCTPVVYAEKVVTWAIPVAPTSMTVLPGERVDFVWTGSHNVWRFPDRASFDACNFDAPGAQVVKQTATSTYYSWLAPATTGSYFFACQVGTHCVAGMKIEMIVSAATVPQWCNPTSSWCVEFGLISTDTIQFTINSTSGNWVGIGFPETAGAMYPADVIVCAEENNEMVISDRHTTAQATPEVDTVSDVEGITSGVEGGVTRCTFRRPLTPPTQSLAAGQDRAIPCTPINFNWVHGVSRALSYHQANRGSAILNFCFVPSCAFKCTTCWGEGEDQCESCDQGYFLSQNSCVAICPAGSFPNQVTRVCDPCPMGCSTCMSNMVCSSCEPSYYLSNAECVTAANCPAGTFADSTSRTCVDCSSECLTCSGAAATCTTCSAPLFHTGTTCVSSTSCPINTFPNSANNRCDSCSTGCTECTSSSSTDCTACDTASGYTLTSGSCVAACGIGQYLQATTCMPCSTGCDHCTGGGATQCTACANTYFLTANGECVQTCPAGTFASGSSCQNCGSPCSRCSGTATTCTGCSSNLFLTGSTCVVAASCPSDTFANSNNNVCSQCDSTCSSCTGPTSNECSACGSNMFLTSTNRCVTAGNCPAATFPQTSSNTCASCHSSCASCTGGNANQCTSCSGSLYLQGTQCVAASSCAAGTFPQTSTHTCASCAADCSSCTSTTNCLSCSGTKFLHNGNCVAACPITLYTNSSAQTCVDASWSCSTDEAEWNSAASYSVSFASDGDVPLTSVYVQVRDLQGATQSEATVSVTSTSGSVGVDLPSTIEAGEYDINVCFAANNMCCAVRVTVTSTVNSASALAFNFLLLAIVLLALMH